MQHLLQKSFFLFGLLAVLTACQSHKSSKHAAGIALSFDDRYVKEWTQLRPLLKKYGAKATFYVTQFDSLSPHEIGQLRDLVRDGHEVGAHGSAHTRVLDFLRGGGSLDEFYKYEIEAELTSMRKAGFNPVTFAHVGGQQTWWTDRRLLRDYFVLLRDVAMTEQKIYFLTFRQPVFAINEAYYKFDGDRKVNALLLDQGTGITSSQLRDGLIRARNTHTVLMLMGHRPLFEPSKEPYAFSVKTLETLLAEAQRMGLKTYTMRELVEKSRE